jgi:hypothetical protein
LHVDRGGLLVEFRGPQARNAVPGIQSLTSRHQLPGDAGHPYYEQMFRTDVQIFPRPADGGTRAAAG